MQDNLLSVILLSYYSKDKINNVFATIRQLMNKENIPFEFIVMDDGSKDNSFEIARKLEVENNNVKAFQLSRNYTSHYSIFAGLSKCTGACAVVIPDDEQQPYHTLVEMYRLWEKGNKIIFPHRISRDDPWTSKIFAGLFYKIMNRLSDVTYPEGGADLFFIDREVIDILNTRIKPINTTTVTELLRLGFDPYFLPYERPLGNNTKSRWNFKKKLKLAMDTFFSCSSFPIKFITFLGIFFSLFSFGLIILYIYIHLFGNSQFWGIQVPGWTSTIIFISFFSGLILFSLGVIAEYIWRIYEEVKSRPGYIIKKK